MQTLVRVLLSLSLIFSPLAKAGPAETVAKTALHGLKDGLTETTRVRPGGLFSESFYSIFSTPKLREAGVVAIKTTKVKGRDVLVFVDKEGKEVLKAAFAPSSPEVLEKFRPSKIRELMVRQSTAVSRLALVKMGQFVPEALSFAFIIGGITAYELFNHYSENPQSLEQYVNGQTDPFSNLSFYLFLYASGMATEPILEIFRNRALHMFLPYFGMSAGMMAQHVTNDFFATPQMSDCAKKSLMHAEDASAVCDKAWENFHAAWNNPELQDQKWREYKMSLLGMFAASAVSGTAAWGVSKVIEFLGVNVAVSLLPGGFLARMPRFAWRILQNGNFMVNMTWLEAPMQTYYFNAVDTAPKLRRESECLGAAVAKLSRTDLHLEERKDVDSILHDECLSTPSAIYAEFLKTMSRFRVENLSPVTTAQRNWEGYLAELTSRYKLSERLYQNLTDSVFNKLYFNKPTQVSPLDVPSPLFGIKPTSDREFSWGHYLEDDITRLTNEQMLSAHAISEAIKNFVSENGKSFSAKEATYMTSIAALLASNKASDVAAAVVMTAKAATPGKTEIPVQSFERVHLSEDGIRIMDWVLDGLGQPAPKAGKGEGYLAAWAKENNINTDPNRPLITVPSRYKHILTPSVPEYLVAGMFFGPDVTTARDEDLIQKRSYGYSSLFVPPRIVPTGNIYSWNDSPTLEDGSKNTIFTNLVWIDSDPTPGCNAKRKECYKPMLSWLAQGFIRSDILPPKANGKIPDSSGFPAWWDRYAKTPYLRAWLDFEDKYEEVINLFVNVFYGEDRSLYIPFTNIKIPWTRYFKNQQHIANDSDVKNGVLAALNQERAVDLLILSQFADPTQFKIRSKAAARRYNLSIVKTADTQGNEWAEFLRGYESQWQEAIRKFIALKGPSTLAKDSGSSKYVPRVSNQSILDAVTELSKSLDTIETQLKAKWPDTDPSEVHKIVVMAIQSLRASHEELKDYARIVNSVSYVEVHEDGSNPIFERCLRTSDPHMNPMRGKDRSKTPNCP